MGRHASCFGYFVHNIRNNTLNFRCPQCGKLFFVDDKVKTKRGKNAILPISVTACVHCGLELY